MCFHFNKLWWLFCVYFVEIYASTHWIVTEGGLIQPKAVSPFELEQPYDLLAFLNQDAHFNNIINLHRDLSQRQRIVQNLWAHLEKYADTSAFMVEHKRCQKVGRLNLINWYASALEVKKEKAEREEMVSDVVYDVNDVPDCKKISSLTFSMCAFEHLDTMKQRQNLNIDPEVISPEKLPKIDHKQWTVDQVGSWLSAVLKKNTSSWVHYNMASWFWRVKGNAPKALECSRRAVHYAPREYKDIALLSLGLLAHRSKMTEDALIILRAAVDHDIYCPINHFMLANVYSIVGEFNNSVKHYKKCLSLNPTFELAGLAEKHKNAVLCYKNISKRMKVAQEILSQLREELLYYSNIETRWLLSQAVVLKTMKLPEGYNYNDPPSNFQKIQELTNINVKKFKQEGDKFSIVEYFLNGPSFNEEWLKDKGVLGIESAYNFETLIKHIGRHADMATQIIAPLNVLKHLNVDLQYEIGPIPTFTDVLPDAVNEILKTKDKPETHKASNKNQPASAPEENISDYYTGIVLYPATISISRNTEDFDKESEWPSNRLCKEGASSFPNNLKGIYQVFLPFENKGIRLKTLLTDKIGVPVNVEHELPWHPPICPTDKEAAAFTQKKTPKPQFASEVIPTDYLRQKLLEYVGDGDQDSALHMQDAEIGQRIYTAIQMKVAPKWILYTLSSLYWRVRENNVNALHCVLTASRSVELRFKDIVLVSLASIYLEMGFFDEALAACEEAFKLNLYEPATNFVLSELNMVKKHRNTHMFHLKQVIRVEPSFMGGIARSILLAWSCLSRKADVMQEFELGDGDFCTQVEPGLSMSCEKDGKNCHLSNIQCFSAHDRPTGESSTIVRVLKFNTDTKQEYFGEDDEVTSRVKLDPFMNDMPLHLKDKTEHQKNYDAMMKVLRTTLKGCGDKGCISKDLFCNRFCVVADDGLEEEQCSKQRLELGYWLQSVTFKELLSDIDPMLVSDILSMEPSNNKIPECSLTVDPSQDFFVDRMLNVDTDGWEPVLSLMHKLAELFNFYDYGTLGAKISAYLETRGGEWVVLAAAGWWCGAGGRGECAARCLAAAHAQARHEKPLNTRNTRALAAVLHIQSKHKEAKEIAYLSFYPQPKSQIDAFLVGLSHTYMAEYEEAVWMYRYVLTFDDDFLPAKACLHTTMCFIKFGDRAKNKNI